MSIRQSANIQLVDPSPHISKTTRRIDKKLNEEMKNLLFTAMLAVLFFACGQEVETPSSMNNSEVSNDFAAFLEEFLQDSLFQMEHTLFPLEGIPDNAEASEMDGRFRWQKKDWRMHRPWSAQSSSFDSEFKRLSSDLVVEKIVHHGSGYAMLRRFARLDGEWMLIYYAGLNPTK